MGRERSDGGMVNNKEKRRFALRRGKNFKNGGEGLEFFILQNFSDCLFLAPQAFVFIQIFQLIPVVAHMEISPFGSPRI